MLLKLPIISKIASSKSCLELNFLQKSQRTHITIYLNSTARKLQRLSWFKYYTVLKWESRFTLRLNDTKITDYINFCLKCFYIGIFYSF